MESPLTCLCLRQWRHRRWLSKGLSHEPGVNRLDPRRWPVQSAIMQVFKIFRRPEWEAFYEGGKTKGAPVDLKDGFIHFSTAQQLAETIALHFDGEDGLLILALDADGLGDELKWEPSRGGDLFPHLYREMLLTDVLWARPCLPGSTGHVLPEGVS
jgi:uncharacterized protein (DUF952 family)